MTKKKVLIVSDSPAITTGFSRVATEITRTLLGTGKYDIEAIAWFHPYNFETQQYAKLDSCPCKLHFVTPGDEKDKYGHVTGRAILERVRPDYVMAIGDAWMIDWIAAHKDLGFRSAVYSPIDGAPFPSAWRPVFRNMDVPVTFTRFAKKVIQDADPFIDVQVINHGVDTSVFKPISIPEREEFKRNTLPALIGKFVVGTAGRNQPRKNYPAIFESFAKFCKDKPDAVLYCHVAENDPVGWNLAEIADRYHLRGKIIIPSMQVCMGVPPEILNKVYNCFDFGVFPYTREGWALCPTECLACGVPIVFSDYGPVPEYAAGCGEPIAIKNYVTATHFNLLDAYVDVDDMVEKMNKLYYNPELRLKYSKNALETAKRLDWSVVNQEWLKIFAYLDSLT